MFDLVRMQQEYFGILSEFFHRATGKKTPDDFCDLDSFSDALKKEPEKLAKNLVDALSWLNEPLTSFYSSYEASTFSAARELGGMKLVIGGTSSFTSANLKGIQKMLLYSDTIFVPDPVLPWIEDERKFEGFRYPRLLENISLLLRLKPLVDAKLQYPAIVVFQSYEKTLERNDKTTIEGQQDLFVQFLAHYLEHEFSSIEETVEYVTKHESEFLKSVEKKNLFVPPEGTGKESLSNSVASYRDWIRTWRSKEGIAVYETMRDGQLVWNGLLERLAHQWHLLDNASSLNCQPMLCLNTHWYYFNLCSELYAARLQKVNLVSKDVLNTLKALNQSQLSWLGNVPIDALAKLREENVNEAFRKKISDFTSQLHGSASEDIDKVTAEVGRGIASLLADHQREMKGIVEKGLKLYAPTTTAMIFTMAASFLPALAPFVNVSPAIITGLVGKMVWDSTNMYLDRKKISNSLMGVLASAKE